MPNGKKLVGEFSDAGVAQGPAYFRARYLLCSGDGVAVREVAQRLLAQAGRPLELRVDPELARPADVPVLVGDPSKLTAATGWQPRHSLDDTLTDMLTAARVVLAG